MSYVDNQNITWHSIWHYFDTWWYNHTIFMMENMFSLTFKLEITSGKQCDFYPCRHISCQSNVRSDATFVYVACLLVILDKILLGTSKVGFKVGEHSLSHNKFWGPFKFFFFFLPFSWRFHRWCITFSLTIVEELQ